MPKHDMVATAAELSSQRGSGRFGGVERGGEATTENGAARPTNQSERLGFVPSCATGPALRMPVIHCTLHTLISTLILSCAFALINTVMSATWCKAADISCQRPCSRRIMRIEREREEKP
ncbi:hypothetical protein CC78DRAFT_325016 [Lojkania enalia]|uniref:Uncharacterized protein n=1 Tax=Lojkania enalia TaxID=147567 RepID=A0A9P4K400_9PLEO|nr:hypothetical protein CC78DRAFT_325016 [Didymosphaeria enalia]